MTNYYNSLGGRMDTSPKNSKIASRCWQLCLMVLFSLFVGQTIVAQTVTIGAGTTTARFPYNYWYGFARSSSIYTATEMGSTTAGFSVTSIGYNCNTAANTGPTVVYMRLVNTTTAQTATPWATKITGATTVYTGTPGNSTGFRLMTLTTPFTVTAGQNLEIMVETNFGGGGTGASTGNAVRYTALTGTHQQWQVDTAPPTTNGTVNGNRPNVQINYVGLSGCSGTPTPGNTISSAATACSGASFNLTLQNGTTGSGVTYAWESADDMAFTTGVTALGTGSTQTTSLTAAKYYRCSVTCAGNTGISTPVLVGLNGFINCYCVTNPTLGGAGDIITGVTVGSYVSGAIGNIAPYFTSVANTPIVITSPSTQPIEITMGTDGTQFSAVWIDFDHSGTFDASENLALATVSAGASAVVSYNLAIPSGALTGLTRMRVRGGSDTAHTAAGACTSTQYGETEDYIVDVQASAACVTPNPGATLSTAATVCVGAPFTLSVTNATSGTGVSYQWESADDMAFTAGVTALGTAFNQAIASQTSAKYYRCNVTCSSGPDTVASTPVLVAQNAPLDCYCTPTYSFGKTSGDLISNISITGTTLANNTGTAQTNPAYTFFNTLPEHTGDLTAGATYAVNVTVGTWGNQAIKAWIDYNDNGLFEVSEEIGSSVIAPGQGNTGPFPAASFSVTLSCSPPLGVHRLRVRSIWNVVAASIDPCALGGFGETEDYLVNVTTADACPTPSVLAATAITSSAATLGWKQGCVETAWDVNVQAVGAGVPTGTPNYPGVTTTSAPGFGTLALSGLTELTASEFYVRAVCDLGLGIYSTWAGPFTFTTTANPPGCATPVSPANAATGVVISSGAATLTWAAPVVTATEGAALTYNVFFGTTSGALNNIGTITAPAVVVGVTGLAFDTIYYWRIAPVNTGGTNATCPEFSFTTQSDPCVGVIPTGSTFADPIDLGAITSSQSIAGNNQGANCFKDNFTTTSTPGNSNAQPGKDVFYKFQITELCNNFTIGTCVPTSPVSTMTDTYLHLLDSTGATIVSDDDDCTTGTLNGSLINGVTTAITSGLVLPIGTYYVVVEGFSVTQEGTFNLDFNYSSTTPASYYTDADNDGYGDANAVAEVACAPVAGKVTDNTDCLDTNAAVSPAAIEVAYDGLDNNCDGVLDEGFPPLATRLVSATCNSTLASISSTIYVDVIPGVTNYRFRVKVGAGTPQIYETTNRYMKLTDLASYLYGTTYTIDVEVRRAGVWLGYYGDACTVTTPVIPVLSGTSCGGTIVNQFSGVFTTPLVGVTSYKFKVTNLTTSNFEEVTNIYNWFNFNMLTGFVYGTSYSVEVAVKTTGSDYSAYGAACTISTPAVPGLSPTSCGATITNNTTGIYTSILSLATTYRFELSNPTTSAVILVLDRSTNWFNFSQVPGHVAGTSYSVRLQLLSKGVYSDWGPSCIINPGSGARFGDSTSPSISTITGTELKAFGYPNPFETNFTLNVTTTSDENVQVVVYDMIGRQVDSKEVNAADANVLEVGSNYPSGVYNVVVSQGANVKSLRMIKR